MVHQGVHTAYQFAIAPQRHRCCAFWRAQSIISRPSQSCRFANTSSRPRRAIPNAPKNPRPAAFELQLPPSPHWTIGRDPKSQKRYKIYLVGSLAFAASLAFYISYVGSSWRRDIKMHAKEKGILPHNSDVSDRWTQLGRDYDDEVEFSEKCFATNMKRKRRQLVAQAYGKVLEVSAGTGRNFPYYDLRPVDPTKTAARNVISSLTINDQSAIMLGIAEDKFDEEQARSYKPFAGPVEFVVGDAGIKGVIQRPEGGYDTIIETMGLCSMVDPVGFLRTMGKLCRQPGEASDTIGCRAEPDDDRGGKILLLEHGRSNWDIVNQILDSGASMHADHYGCWWNKNIAEIVQQSGLEVEQIKRYHFGTTWEIHLRPKPDR